MAIVLAVALHFGLSEPFLHWTYVHTGIKGFGSWYGFFSGFGGILERLLELAVIGAILLFRHNCHHRGCWRIGRFPANEGGGWRYCRTHHNSDGVHQ